MKDERPNINLARFKRHEKKFPWTIIRKLIIAIILLGLMYFAADSLKNAKNNQNQIDAEGQP